MFVAKVYIYIYLKHKILVPSLFMYSICSEHRTIPDHIFRFPAGVHVPRGLVLCKSLVFVFRV